MEMGVSSVLCRIYLKKKTISKSDEEINGFAITERIIPTEWLGPVLWLLGTNSISQFP